jgi:hypothetical protein
MGEGHLRDPRWPTEEWTDDRRTWGKMTAKKQGLAMWKESPNGAANWWRAAGGPHLSVGERSGERGRFARHHPVYRGWRERGGGPRTPTACRTGWTTLQHRVLRPGSLTGGPRSVFSNLA